MSQPQQLPHGESAETLLESMATQLQINAASVKIPDFWNTSLEVWFATVEAQFSTKHISQDQTKYDYVVSALDVKTAEEVQEVLIHPPRPGQIHIFKKGAH